MSYKAVRALQRVCAQALAKALQEGAAPELIMLDMRGNPLSDEALDALVPVPCHQGLHRASDKGVGSGYASWPR